MQKEVIKPQIDESWKNVLEEQFQSQRFKELKQFLVEDRKKYVVYPPAGKIFSAYNHTPFDKVRIVILGQDPYHGEGQANGLCFSVSPGIPHPPSLKNIFKELQDDLGLPIPVSGDLSAWADQGILLLNATLTVRKGEAGSHQKRGWEEFTDASIKALSDKRNGIIFLLWGRFAISKRGLIDEKKHIVLHAAHPSPLSAYNGFFGCRHFSKVNALLKQRGEQEINWALK